MTAQPVNPEQALQDPASVSATPDEVAQHADLTREQKIEILSKPHALLRHRPGQR